MISFSKITVITNRNCSLIFRLMVILFCQALLKKIHMGYSYQFRKKRYGNHISVTYDNYSVTELFFSKGAFYEK